MGLFQKSGGGKELTVREDEDIGILSSNKNHPGMTMAVSQHPKVCASNTEVTIDPAFFSIAVIFLRLSLYFKTNQNAITNKMDYMFVRGHLIGL